MSKRLRTRTLTLEPFSLVVALSFLGCASGHRWVNEGERREIGGKRWIVGDSAPSPRDPDASPPAARTIGPAPAKLSEAELADAPGKRPLLSLDDRSAEPSGLAPPDAKFVGVFRNTYYDFPAETEFTGRATPLHSASCSVLRQVPRPFFEAVCVQGSGTLATGRTVSFAKRDCSCADVCPRTGQKICFDELDEKLFPWGRGALGKAIVPLRTIAVDSAAIPLGTVVYISEFDGVPRSPGGAPHDGCFVAEDRGLKVVGEHVDVFTGNPKTTAHLNSLVPSNKGVHVFTGTAKCQ